MEEGLQAKVQELEELVREREERIEELVKEKEQIGEANEKEMEDFGNQLMGDFEKRMDENNEEIERLKEELEECQRVIEATEEDRARITEIQEENNELRRRHKRDTAALERQILTMRKEKEEREEQLQNAPPSSLDRQQLLELVEKLFKIATDLKTEHQRIQTTSSQITSLLSPPSNNNTNYNINVQTT
eukprot:TRINITY_DN2782_c0_g1_i1.p1 TRINITY_DN2782_c0_g1~~TRINITY_DN2782_c0_g1_i1.p1  ORF type:complete len:189 (+),score=76.41 TRINITY_DN2782_c0_g1_i1:218-784(+)